MTKPKISFRRKVWDCKLSDFWATGVWGFGDSPESAYWDWYRQQAALLLSILARAA